MRVYFDTDALSHLENCLREPGAVVARVSSKGASLTASEHLLEEVLVTGDPERRRRIATALVTLLEHGGVVLAPLSWQLSWGWHLFRAGCSNFYALPAVNQGILMAMLRDAGRLPEHVRLTLREKGHHDVSTWDAMHREGRAALNKVRSNGIPMPSARDCVEHLLDSEFAEECVMEAVGAGLHERAHVAQYLRWSPLCRMWLEMLLLEIHRNAIRHVTHRSKMGPKWQDVSHSSFAPLVDWFVTDDRRFRASLVEHHGLRGDATWRVGSLQDFLLA